jgi:murein DD-endopeptidase MepM/ murein hydrolase activator NlpD
MSAFGRRGGRPHQGVDIDAPYGAPIVAAQTGTVTLAGWKNGYGQTVIIDHGEGLRTLYAHQSRILVRGGQRVTQGQQIGIVGATGRVTAPHLHYEVHVNGVPRNPSAWL